MNESYVLLSWCILFWSLKALISHLLEKKDEHSVPNYIKNLIIQV